jgi:hypothetical protein
MDDFTSRAEKVIEMLKNVKDLLVDLDEAYEDMRDKAGNNNDKKKLLATMMMHARNAKSALCAMPRHIALDGPAMANEIQRQMNAIHALDAAAGMPQPIALDGPAMANELQRQLNAMNAANEMPDPRALNAWSSARRERTRARAARGGATRRLKSNRKRNY